MGGLDVILELCHTNSKMKQQRLLPRQLGNNNGLEAGDLLVQQRFMIILYSSYVPIQLFLFFWKLLKCHLFKTVTAGITGVAKISVALRQW